MTNDQVYAAGLLKRALDPGTQPPEIQEFLRAELDLLQEFVAAGARLLDVGCGTGRHLRMLADRISLGVGIDYEHNYIAEAHRQVGDRRVHFVTADATLIPLRSTFDCATCLTNTWGTMSDKVGVLDEMRRLAPLAETRLLSVYSLDSIPPRREWYRRLGHSSTIVGPGGNDHAVFHYGAIVTSLSYSLGAWPLSIWYHRKWSTALKGAFDAILYGVATGLVFSSMWPKM